MTRSSLGMGRGVTLASWLFALNALALATAGCSSEPISSEQTEKQEGALLYQMSYSSTGSISIYELEDKNLLVKATGSIDQDDPTEVRNLLALGSFPAIYSKLNHGAPAPEKLVELDARYREGFAKFAASEEFQSRAALETSTPSAETGTLQDKSEATFNSTVCNVRFRSAGYAYVPKACNYWFQSYAENTFANPTYRVPGFDGAKAYDWIFGWNDVNTTGNVHLLQPVYYGYARYGSCSIAPYTWGHCSWGGSFTRYEAEITNDNSYSPLGVTIHSVEAYVK